MNDDKVYYPPTIPDLPFPQQTDVSQDVSQSSNGDIFSPPTIKDRNFPERLHAVELLSTSLNTKSRKILGVYGFTPSGAIQIGTYENGISGDIRISPAGLVVRNKAGNTTIAADGETGDGVFAGELRSGTLITGEVIVGDNAVTINGEDRRIVVHDGTNPRIVIGNV